MSTNKTTEKNLQPGEKVTSVLPCSIACTETDLGYDHQVEWNSSSGRVVGTVEEKLTEPTHIKGHKVAASEENPEYLVHSDKTGARAAHKPDALTSLDRPGEEESSTSAEEGKNKKRERDEGKDEAEKREEKLTEEAQAKSKKSEESQAKKPKLDDEASKKTDAEAPEERRQEQVAANE